MTPSSCQAPEGALTLWRRLPPSRTVLRQEYAIAIKRIRRLEELREGGWAAFLTRELVTDAVAEYVADPFLLRRRGMLHLFFEVLNLGTGRGEIAVAHSVDGAHWIYGGLVLRENGHLSYPYVFMHGGEVYMVPESSGRRTVSLYRADAFPGGWRRVADLLTGAEYLDSSLFQAADGWWLVTNTLGAARPLVFRADRLEGPWVPGPVSTGEDGPPRSAGRIFQLGEQWHRPVQRAGQVYGEDVWLRQLELGDGGDYHEVPAPGVPGPLLAPRGRGWNSLGMHHLDVLPDGDGLLVAVDGKALIVDASPLRLGLRLRNRLSGIGRS